MNTSQTPQPESSKQLRKVLISSYLGTMLEYYDFLLYGTAAALVFGPVFFANLSPIAGTIASLGTFAVGYIARPLGAVIFGHFGDKFGRKRALLASMWIMGLGSCLIGVIPSSDVIGSWAAIILILLRVVQGIAMGGEWGGAALMALEHAETKKRGFQAAFTNAGGPSGSVLATVAMALVALLPEQQFMSWGWRLPFLASAAMLVLGIYMRRQIDETPVFKAAIDHQEKKLKDAAPIVEVLKRPKTVILVALAIIGSSGMQTAFSTFGVTYAVQNGGDRTQVLMAFAIAWFFAIFLTLGYAKLSDRLGRRPVLIFGMATLALSVYPLFTLLGRGTFGSVVVAFIIFAVFHSATYGPLAAFLPEQFSTRSRYTGASLSNQLSTLLGAGFTPVILGSLVAANGGSIVPVAIYMAAMCAISITFLLILRESKDNDLETVGTVRVPAEVRTPAPMGSETIS
jgi:MFS family permease